MPRNSAASGMCAASASSRISRFRHPAGDHGRVRPKLYVLRPTPYRGVEVQRCGMIAVTRLRRAAQRIDPRLVDLAIALLSLAIMISGLAGKVAVDGQRPADIGGYLIALGINLAFAIHRR